MFGIQDTIVTVGIILLAVLDLHLLATLTSLVALVQEFTFWMRAAVIALQKSIVLRILFASVVMSLILALRAHRQARLAHHLPHPRHLALLIANANDASRNLTALAAQRILRVLPPGIIEQLRLIC
jgi:hypothetical protein